MYIVFQTFEALGDPCAENFNSLEAAVKGSIRFRQELAKMLASWPTPDRKEIPKTGYIHEVTAWNHAIELANGKKRLGYTAGQYLANAAVVIEQIK